MFKRADIRKAVGALFLSAETRGTPRNPRNPRNSQEPEDPEDPASRTPVTVMPPTLSPATYPWVRRWL